MLQIWIIIYTLYATSTGVAAHRHERCGPHRMGVCKVVWHCPEALDLLKRGIRPALCGYNNYRDQVVCCPTHRHDNEPIKFPTRISQKKCQEYEEKICDGEKVFEVAAIGGVPAKPKELPFMGLIGYGRKSDIDWACGCSLISEKFVLSAAHCTKHPTGGFANWVRLGELDLNSTTDIARPEDFRIIRRIDHPDYRSRFAYNDITLFELDREVEGFTSFIQPLCLPTPESFDDVSMVVAAGWGTTDIAGPRSPSLMKVDLNLFPVNECEETASDRVRLPEGLDDRSMICAGSTEGGKDTCSGDSGGPLFLPRDENKRRCSLLYQLGVTSFGKLCAVKGLPGVYTNVLHFVPWIESIVWSDDSTEIGAEWSG